MTPQFILIYCTENQDLANKFSEDLASSGAKFTHVKADENNNLSETLSSSTPAILLVTDNFLKNKNCMVQAYSNYGQMIKNGRLLVIVAEGKVINADGSITHIATHFERVANVIQYMNYWQDQYLALRKQHNQGLISENEVSVVKTISTEVGDFMRMLRDANFQYYENITARNYQQFCQLAGLPLPIHVIDRTETPIIPIFTPPQPLPVETPVVLDNHLISNIESPKQETEDEAIESIIDQIPGLNLLPPTPSDKPIATPAKEIDEDDFFNEKEENFTDSNISEVMAEVISEEDTENDDQKNEENETDINSIFDEDDVDDIFQNITGANPTLIKETDTSINTEVPSPSKEADFQEVIEEEVNTEDEIEETIETVTMPLETAEMVKTAPIASDETHSTTIEDEVKNEIIDESIEETPTIEVEETVINGEQQNDENKTLESPKSRLQMAFDYAKQQDFKAATTELEEVLAENPNNSDAYFLMAEISELNHDFIMARAYYEKAANISPYYPLVYQKLANLSALHFADDKKQTKKYFKKAIDLDENNADLLYAYADFLNVGLDNEEKAIKYFKRALKVNPEHPFAHYDLATIYYKVGEHSLASEHYREACENNPELETPENDKAFLEYKILDIDRAGEAINLHSIEEEYQLQPIENQIDTTKNTENELEASISAPIIDDTDSIEDNTEVTVLAPIEEEVAVIKSNKYKPKEGRKIVLITGATAGIGRATAEIFAKNGYNLILTGRREERLIEIQNAFHEQYEGGCIILDFDIRNIESIKTTFDNLNKEWSAIDILINNAGLAVGFAPIHEGDLGHWDTMIDTNIKGLLYMTRMIAPQMVERKTGHIINLCSTAGKEAYPNGNVYCATKFAVEALTRNMRIDLHKFGIRVGQVSPGAVEETEFSEVRFEGDKERAAKVYEGFTPLRASDVADIIYYMASAPAHVNIQDVLVMGTQQANATIIDRSGR